MSVTYKRVPYIFKDHIEVWYKGERIGTINHLPHDIGWEFLSYPLSLTSCRWDTEAEVKLAVESIKDKLYDEGYKT